MFQPLGVVIFYPVKAHFNKLTQNFKLATLGWTEPINSCKTIFTKIFKQPWKSIRVALVKKGCAISPLNRNGFDTSRLNRETVSTNHEQSQTPVSVPDKQTGPSLHQPIEQSASSLTKPLVSSGIIPANLMDSFIILAMKQKKTTTRRVVTKSRILTSNKHVDIYEEIKKIGKAEEAKKKRKEEKEQRKAEI